MLFNAVPDLSQTRLDIFENGLFVQSYSLDQALCDYDHILDNLHALEPLLEETVQTGTLKRVTSDTFLLEPWDYQDLTDEIAPRQTKTTAAILEKIEAIYRERDGIEIYATESLNGTWYQKQ